MFKNIIDRISILVVLGSVFVSPVYSSELISVEHALKQVFNTASTFKKEEYCLSPEQVLHIQDNADLIFKDTHTLTVKRYVAMKDEQIIGYGFEDIVHGKWGPIYYLATVGVTGEILEIVVLDYQEIRGKPIAKKRFLKQYKGKTISHPLRLRKDIDGITGATISSRSITEGIRKILFIYRETKDPSARKACEKS